MTTPTLPRPATRWIDSVAHHYDEDSPATVALANLHFALVEADHLAEELARFDCDETCGARGYGNDPDRIDCSCVIGTHDGRVAAKAADNIQSWAARVHPFSLYNGTDMHLYTRALRAWQLLQCIRAGEPVYDVRNLATEVREVLA